jgi:hypothetical protein
MASHISMRPYKNMKTVFVSNLVAGTSFKQSINIPFNVDEISVRSFTFLELDDANDYLSVLKSTLVNGPMLTIGLFAAGTCTPVFVNTPFIGPHRPIQGEYTFEWLTADLTPVTQPNTFHNQISIQLVFIEY